MAQNTTATIQTHDDWFDCDCATNYQHRKGHTCDVCGMSNSEDAADSRISELIENGKLTPEEASRHLHMRAVILRTRECLRGVEVTA
jgi:tRNA(Ile2) C34 agmatinyltransferase TiaS